MTLMFFKYVKLKNHLVQRVEIMMNETDWLPDRVKAVIAKAKGKV